MDSPRVRPLRQERRQVATSTVPSSARSSGSRVPTDGSVVIKVQPSVAKPSVAGTNIESGNGPVYVTGATTPRKGGAHSPPPQATTAEPFCASAVAVRQFTPRFPQSAGAKRVVHSNNTSSQRCTSAGVSRYSGRKKENRSTSDTSSLEGKRTSLAPGIEGAVIVTPKAASMIAVPCPPSSVKNNSGDTSSGTNVGGSPSCSTQQHPQQQHFARRTSTSSGGNPSPLPQPIVIHRFQAERAAIEPTTRREGSPIPLAPPASSSCSTGGLSGSSCATISEPVANSAALPIVGEQAQSSRGQSLSALGSEVTVRSDPQRQHQQQPVRILPDVAECVKVGVYDAFAFDQQKSRWEVRKDVLHRCLEYVQVFRYKERAVEVMKPIGVDNSSSLPHNVSTPSPLRLGTHRLQRQKVFQLSTRSPRVTPCSPSESPPVSPSETSVGSESPFASPAQTPLLDAAHKDSIETEHIEAPFIPGSAACRWLGEQEFVIGTILLCYAYGDSDSAEFVEWLAQPWTTTLPAEIGGTCGEGMMGEENQRATTEQHGQKSHASGSPSSSFILNDESIHPIQLVAGYVTEKYPQWGALQAFTETWNIQVRLVLGTASPSHQKQIKVHTPGGRSLVFSSDMEAGNLQSVEPYVIPGNTSTASATTVYQLKMEGDMGSEKRIWFRFAISGCLEKEPVCLKLVNIAPHMKLYRNNGMKPVWKAGVSQPNWTPVDDIKFQLVNDERSGELSFYIVPRSSRDTIHVAFCVPYTYSDLLCHITQWHSQVKESAASIRFEERVLCRTLDQRKLHLLIVTSQSEKVPGYTKRKKAHHPLNESATNIKSRVGNGGVRAVTAAGFSGTPYSNFSTGKKVVLVSARVHPGEVTASHAVHGLMSFLLSSHPNATLLRSHFVFFVVPMLNPDGVSRGHSRQDQNGVNLNRCYNEPNSETQPTVHALKNVFDHLQNCFGDRFFMYQDFHSHASQQSGFAFGNFLPNTVQHWNMLYPRLIALRAPSLFDFDTCKFGKYQMTSKDGTSRVLFGGCLIHAYTVELTHFTDFSTSTTGLEKSGLTPFDELGQYNRRTSNSSRQRGAKSSEQEEEREETMDFILNDSGSVGRACVESLLDYCSINPVHHHRHHSFSGRRGSLHREVSPGSTMSVQQGALLTGEGLGSTVGTPLMEKLLKEMKKEARIVSSTAAAQKFSV